MIHVTDNFIPKDIKADQSRTYKFLFLEDSLLIVVSQVRPVVSTYCQCSLQHGLFPPEKNAKQVSITWQCDDKLFIGGGVIFILVL